MRWKNGKNNAAILFASIRSFAAEWSHSANPVMDSECSNVILSVCLSHIMGTTWNAFAVTIQSKKAMLFFPSALSKKKTVCRA